MKILVELCENRTENKLISKLSWWCPFMSVYIYIYIDTQISLKQFLNFNKQNQSGIVSQVMEEKMPLQVAGKVRVQF